MALLASSRVRPGPPPRRSPRNVPSPRVHPQAASPGAVGKQAPADPRPPGGSPRPWAHWTGLPGGGALAWPTPSRQASIWSVSGGGGGLGLCRPRRACFHWGSSQKTWVTLCFLTAAQQAGHVLLEACEDTEGAGRTCLAPLTAPALGPARAVMPGSQVPGVRPGGGVASRPGSSGSRRRGTGRGPRPPPCSRGTPGLRQGGRRERHRPAAWAASPLRKTGLTGTACRGGALAPGLPWCLS